MEETAAPLCDHVFPRLPVRQWVLLVPKRLRYFMQRDGAVLNMVLRIFLRFFAQSLLDHSLGAVSVDKAALHIGAVAFIHRFGSILNGHVHFHVCVVDGVFEEVELFHWTTLEQPLVSVGFQPIADLERHIPIINICWLGWCCDGAIQARSLLNLPRVAVHNQIP